MTTVKMADTDIDEVSALLCTSYALLAEREKLSAEQEQYLVSQRGSAECVRRKSRTQHYLVARNDERLVGVVAVRGDTIEKLYVHPACIGTGVGRTLYESAESLIRGRGHRHVRLGAFPTAVPFYQRMGLSTIGEKPIAGPLAGRTVMLMEKKMKHA